MRTGVRSITALVAATAAVAVAGCTSARPVATPDDDLDLDLVVDVERPRAAAARGVMYVRLVNQGALPLEVTSLQLRDPRFTSVPADAKSTEVAVGGTPITTPIDHGQPVCTTAQGPASVVVTVATPDAASRTTTLPVGTAGERMLDQLHTSVCRERAVARAATVAFGPDWEPVAPAVARGAIEIVRGDSDAPITLEQVQGTVIFGLTVTDRDATEGGPVLVLPAGDRRATVPVEVSAARCDPHALIESKRTYLFPTWVRVGDDEVVPTVTEPTGAARRALEALIEVGCDVAH